MELTILDPDIVVISEQNWLCDEYRDDYLEHFFNILNGIDATDNISLAWCNQMDEIIWSSPQKLPWRRDSGWNNALFPVIYKKFTKNYAYIDVPENAEFCDASPRITCYTDDLNDVFSQLLGVLHNNCNKIIIAFGLNNLPLQKHEFKIGGADLIPIPILIDDEAKLLKQIDVAREFWPSSQNDSSAFDKGISIIFKREYGVESQKQHYSSSVRFLKKLSSTTSDKNKILNSIAKRLSMTMAEAGRDGGLLDEGIVGDAETRRFRVTQVERIHYKIIESTIHFLMFYSDGEHDDGL